MKKVLYGSYSGKTITLAKTFPYWNPTTEEFLVAAIPSYYKEEPDYTALYSLSESEERAETALCRARLDYATLSSFCIFIGKESLPNARRGRNSNELESLEETIIEVVKPIYGKSPQPGEKIYAMEAANVMHNSSYHRRITIEPQIFFISSIDSDKKPLYMIYTQQPADQETKVREALARRNEYPVTESKEEGQAKKYREILFLGSNDEAIALLSSSNEAVIDLMHSTLMHRGKTAQPDVVAALKNRLFDFTVPQTERKWRAFSQGKYLIELLGDLERKEGGEEIEKLIVFYLDRVEAGEPEPPKNELRHRFNEEDSTDANRSLCWLLEQLDQKTARDAFGSRLFALREKVSGRWKDALQQAMDVIRLEDALEVEAAMKTMQGVQPARSEAGIVHADFPKGTVPNAAYANHHPKIYFSRDGKQILSYGDDNRVGLWDAATMKMIRQTKIRPDLTVMGIREPDGRMAVYFDAEHVRKSTNYYSQTSPAETYDAETDRYTAKMELPLDMGRNVIHWIDNHEAIVANESGLTRFNYQNGVVTNTLAFKNSDLLNGWGNLSEDRQTLVAFHGGSKYSFPGVQVDYIDITTGKCITKKMDGDIYAWTGGLVPGGKYFYMADPCLYIFDRKTIQPLSKKILKYSHILEIAFDGEGNSMALLVSESERHPKSTDGVTREQTDIVRVLDTATCKTLYAFRPEHKPSSVKMSLDGRQIALSNADGTIEVWAIPEKSN